MEDLLYAIEGSGSNHEEKWTKFIDIVERKGIPTLQIFIRYTARLERLLQIYPDINLKKEISLVRIW
jgi:hypothetical protein